MAAPAGTLVEPDTGAASTPDAGAPPASARPSALRQFGHYLGMPLAVAAALVLLYVWVQAQELNDIDHRLLNATIIRITVIRHMELVGLSTLFVIVLAVPLGILLTRRFARPIVGPVMTVANMGQAIPSLGVLVLMAIMFGIGFRYAVIALIIYAFLPVLRNTMVGLEQVDQSVIEAGRGMGMTSGAILRKIELPLAVPVTLAGIRTALVINVGTAAVAVLTNAGGLGQILYTAIVQSRETVIIAGAVITAAVALLVDHLAKIAEEHLSPRGL